MKLDKETIIILLVAIIIAISINPILEKLGLMKPAVNDKNVNQAISTVQKVTPVATDSVKVNKKEETKTIVKKVDDTVSSKIKYQSYNLENNDTKVTIDNSGAVTNYDFLQVKKAKSKENVTLNTALNTSKKSQAFAVQLPTNWQAQEVIKSVVSEDKKTFTLTRMFKSSSNKSEKITVTQVWTLKEKYQMTYNVLIKNASQASISIPNVKILNIALLPTKQMTGDEARSEHLGADCLDTNDDLLSFRVKADKDDNDFLSVNKDQAKWIAVSNKYFAAIIKSDNMFTDGIETFCKKYDNKLTTKKDDFIYKITIEGNLGAVTLASLNESKEFNFDCFVGPKSIANLREFDKTTSKVMHLIGGWSIFNDIAVFMLMALNFLKGTLGNSYGWAIVALTLIVRFLFWPLTQKSNKSMKKMQALQPKIKEIREKYKDSQLQSAKTMELYRKEKVNPVGGCLPLFLQFPVFIALYWALDGDVGLRQQAFGWAKDLAQPDTVVTIAGIAINPLVIMWAILMFVQQKLTPSAMDKNQQIIMYAMPAVMLFMLYGLPSGLTLYWTVSQIFSIVQMLINNRSGKKEEQSTAKAS